MTCSSLICPTNLVDLDGLLPPLAALTNNAPWRVR
jgi:hypothetical protein